MCDTSHMTDRSRLVLAIADQRARNLGLKAVMPEHLLFALAAEGNNIASHVLRYVGAENEDVQDALSAGQIATLEDKTPRLPCDDATKHVLVQSSAELIPLRHNYFDCIQLSPLMDALRRQAFTFFPMVESGDLVSLQATGGLSGDDLGVVAVEFPMQRRSQQYANLWDGDRRRGFFFPAGFLA